MEWQAGDLAQCVAQLIDGLTWGRHIDGRWEQMPGPAYLQIVRVSGVMPGTCHNGCTALFLEGYPAESPFDAYCCRYFRKIAGDGGVEVERRVEETVDA